MDKRLRKAASILALLSLQSERYQNDMDFRDAVDNVLYLLKELKK